MKKTLAIAAVALLVAGAAQAQSSASISATASIAANLGVARVTDLAFGTVFPGFARTVDPITGGASAGSFSLTGQANAQLNLTWSVPANLTDGGTNLLPVAFTASYNTTNSQATSTSLTIPDNTKRLSGTGQAFVWIGGTVTPAGNQAVASYSGTVQLTAAYTGQ